jgi:hypothetical protein
MRKRYYIRIFLCFAAALLSGMPGAWGADSLWDLLRSADPARSRTATPAPGAGNADPKTVQPHPPPPRKKRGGVIGVFDTMRTSFQRFGKQFHSDLKITGNHTFGWHMESVSGNNQAYQNDVYYGRKGFGGAYQNTDLTIQGKLFNLFNFETHYSNNLYGNPYENRVSLNYATKHFSLDAGDINGSIKGNTLIDFNRTLKGIQLSADIARGVKITSLFSQTKAQTRTIVIPGGNGPGPYYVYVGQIVDGSVHVRVNNKDMVMGPPPDGDYTLDPYTGELMFKPGTIIGELDVIAVTFETYGYNQTPGLLTGWRADLDMLKNTRFGLTYLAENSSAGSRRPGEKTDQFQGYGGDPNTAYVLDFPVDVTLSKDSAGKMFATPKYPMKVTVSGVEKVYGTDYVVDPLLTNRVYFAYPIPLGQLVRITYTPSVNSSTPGNRTIMGADASLILGKTGTITAEMATSKYDLSGNGISGGAWQVRSDLRFLKDRLHINWALKNIGSDFTAIESPGFRTNERGLTLGLDYAFSPALKLTTSMESTRRPSYSYSSFGSSAGLAQTTGLDNFEQFNMALAWQLGKAGQLRLTHNSAGTRMSGGGKSLYGTDSLDFNYAFKSLSMGLTVGRNVNESQYSYQTGAGGSSDATTSLSDYSTNSLTSTLNLKWRASENMTFAAILANSMIKGTNGSNTSAQDMQFTAEIKPLRNMRLSLGFQNQNSGSTSIYGTNGYGSSATTVQNQLVSLNRQISGLPGSGSSYYTGGSSYGGLPSYGGGGIYSGLGGYGNYSGGISGGYSGYSFSSFGGKSRGITFAMNYQPWQALTLDFNWNTSTSEGNYLYNSRRNDIGLNITYSLGQRLTVSSHFSVQKVSYIGSSGGTSSNLAFFTIQGKPVGKLGVTLNYQMMRTNSAYSLTNTGTGTGTTIGTGGTTGGIYTGGNPFLNPGTGTGYYGLGATNLTGFGLRLEYPLWRGNNLFLQFDNSVSTGTYGAIQRQLSFGMDFNMGNNMVFTLGWRVQESTTSSGGASGGNYSYRVGSLDADLNLHF